MSRADGLGKGRDCRNSEIAIKLSPHEKASYPAKITPKYAGPWVAVARYHNGLMYRVRDAVNNEERQVTRSQFKLLDLPDNDPAEATLPRLRVEDPRTIETTPDSTAVVDGMASDHFSESRPQHFRQGSEYRLRPVAARRAREGEARCEQQRAEETVGTTLVQQGVDIMPVDGSSREAR